MLFDLLKINKNPCIQLILSFNRMTYLLQYVGRLWMCFISDSGCCWKLRRFCRQQNDETVTYWGQFICSWNFSSCCWYSELGKLLNPFMWIDHRWPLASVWPSGYRWLQMRWSDDDKIASWYQWGRLMLEILWTKSLPKCHIVAKFFKYHSKVLCRRWHSNEENNVVTFDGGSVSELRESTFRVAIVLQFNFWLCNVLLMLRLRSSWKKADRLTRLIK